MSTLVRNVITVSFAASLLSGCAVAKTTGKVAALPFKATYETTKFVGKSAYKTTEFAGKSVVATGKGVYKTTEFVGKGVTATGKGVYKTTEAVGKGVYNTGKGIYYIGTVPVRITDKALDTGSKVLTLTTQMIDATGKAVSVTRQIQAAKLDMELGSIKGATNILSVVVDAL